jgi:diaminohydroxyphosphoribosylaminopyrimidine deaminase/5-amino-6-(5-phosphoribosylamino)uracil reductase
MFDDRDLSHMQRALDLAGRGLYTTTPNPRVGCVIVSPAGERVGEGWHVRAGEPHAEVIALRAAGEAARGASAYVTLEPCSHFGRTPPCADALVRAGVSRVIVAMQDPNPQVSGRGLQGLRDAGIEVRCGLLGEAARELNIGFVSRMERQRPWMRLKVACSLDGYTALPDRTSQWITGPAARADGHAWRARACAILTGIGTVRDDDPRLDVREHDTPRQPLKVLVDSRLQVRPDARLLSGAPVLVACALTDPAREQALRDRGCEILHLPDPRGKVDLSALVRALAERGLNEIHVEAGHKLNGSLLQAGLIDELLMYLAPCALGAGLPAFDLPAPASLASRLSFTWHEVQRVGEDLRLIARLKAAGSGPAATPASAAAPSQPPHATH